MTVRPAEGTIDGMVSARAAARPDGVAVVGATGSRSYGQLDDRARRWQSRLSGVAAPGVVVTVVLPRGERLIEILLGILRCGAAYQALDPDWPNERIATAVALAGGPVVTSTTYAGHWAAGQLIVGEDPEAPPATASRSRPEFVATVFLTSGSTGTPKAVESTHRGAVHVLAGQDYADFGPGCVMLHAAPTSWDGTTLELWAPLMNGGTVAVAEDDPDLASRLRRQVQRDGVTTVWLTASVCHALVEDDLGAFAGLRHVLTGGEAVSAGHLRRLQAAYPDLRITNGYGPCEATVFVTTFEVGSRLPDDVPLGTALEGVPIELSSRGEIVVGGPGLATCYRREPRLTARMFRPGPGGSRRYHTGDAGEWDESGVLRYRGRLDRQLKARGQRVEPEEVEAFVEGALGVQRAVVTPVSGPIGEVVGLDAHVIGHPPDASAMSSRLMKAAEALPAYLRPQRLLVHERFPLLPNGKVNRAALCRSVSGGRQSATDRDRTPPDTVDSWLIGLLEELGLRLLPMDNLRGTGLDSLTTLRLLRKMHAGGRRVLSPVDVARCDTVADLARTWERRAGTAAEAAPVRRALPRAVFDMWLHEQVHPGDPGAMVAAAFEVGSSFDPAAWGRAVRAVCAAHPLLGSTLDFDDASLALCAAPADALDRLASGTPWPDTARLDGRLIDIPRDAIAPFDLEVEPPWRWYHQPDRGLLLVVLHHLAVDGWTERILLDHLGASYQGGALPGPAALPPAGRAHSCPGNYWRTALAGASLPRPEPPTFRGAAAGESATPCPREIRLTHADALRGGLGADAVARQSALLVALSEAVTAVTQAPNPVVGVAYHGRDESTEDWVGLTVDMIPIAVGQSASAVTAQWLDAIEHRACFSRNDLPGTTAAGPKTGRTPFPIGFAMQPAAPADLDLGEVAATRLPVLLGAPPFDVYVETWPIRGGLRILVHHDHTRVAGHWAAQVADAFETCLRRRVDREPR